MSIKMLKNTSGNSGGSDSPTVSTGRRTPLSLGSNSSKTNKQHVTDASVEITSNDIKQSRVIIDLTTDSKIGTTSSSSSGNSNTVGQKKTENGQDDKKSTNGHKTEKSSRQQKEIETNKTEITQQKLNNDIDGEIILKPGPKSKKEKDLKELKERTSESVPPNPIATKHETNTTAFTPTKSPSKRPQRGAAIAANASISAYVANASISSLAADKELKGFGDEMESLIYPDNIQMSNSMSGANVVNSKDVNLSPVKDVSETTSGEAIPTQMKDANEKENNKKKNENVKEQKKNETEKEDSKIDVNKKYSADTPLKSSCIPVPITSTPEGKRIPLTRPPSSLRQISGRRSLRPSKDRSFQSQYRESYRKINTEFDLTNSSLNVTVGSELNANDSASSSFFFWSRGRKRERTPPPTLSSTTDILSIDSPKRARLDFSGFFGLVASPVTMLRAKLARTKIENCINDIDGVENLGEKNSEDITNEILQDNEENSNGKTEDEESDVSHLKDNDEDEQIEINEKSFKSSSDDEDQELNDSDDNMEQEVPKRRCNVM